MSLKAQQGKREESRKSDRSSTIQCFEISQTLKCSEEIVRRNELGGKEEGGHRSQNKSRIS